jgi:hypothetical protein
MFRFRPYFSFFGDFCLSFFWASSFLAKREWGRIFDLATAFYCSTTPLNMALSMHSHSGQFCPGHAKDSLEDIIQTAIAKGMQTFALTEHMPRICEEDLYPEEVSHAFSLLYYASLCFHIGERF